MPVMKNERVEKNKLGMRDTKTQQKHTSKCDEFGPNERGSAIGQIVRSGDEAQGFEVLRQLGQIGSNWHGLISNVRSNF